MLYICRLLILVLPLFLLHIWRRNYIYYPILLFPKWSLVLFYINHKICHEMVTVAHHDWFPSFACDHFNLNRRSLTHFLTFNFLFPTSLSYMPLWILWIDLDENVNWLITIRKQCFHHYKFITKLTAMSQYIWFLTFTPIEGIFYIYYYLQFLYLSLERINLSDFRLPTFSVINYFAALKYYNYIRSFAATPENWRLRLESN